MCSSAKRFVTDFVYYYPYFIIIIHQQQHISSFIIIISHIISSLSSSFLPLLVPFHMAPSRTEQAMAWHGMTKTHPDSTFQSIPMTVCPRHGLFSIVFSLSIYYTVYSDELEAASDFPCPMTKEACPTVCKSFKMELPTVGAIDATQYIIM